LRKSQVYDVLVVCFRRTKRSNVSGILLPRNPSSALNTISVSIHNEEGSQEEATSAERSTGDARDVHTQEESTDTSNHHVQGDHTNQPAIDEGPAATAALDSSGVAGLQDRNSSLDQTPQANNLVSSRLTLAMLNGHMSHHLSSFCFLTLDVR
jgi:hypothetical protein